MGSVVLIPAALSIWFCLRRTPVDALLSVYLTAVLFCPDWARWVLPHLPDPTCDEAAILPLVALVLLRYRPRWKFSFLDFLIFPLPVIMGLSEYVNAGYADAQNLLFDMLASSILPYLMAKLLINSHALRVRFAKHLVLCLSVLFFTSLYEFKFAVNPFHMLFNRFFPSQGDGWVTTFRDGFPRVAGPFSHAILNGVVLMIGLQFAIWLKDSRLWERRKSALSVTALLLELLITFTRGPQIGAVLSYCLHWLGGGPNAKHRARILGAAVLLIGVPVAVWFLSYASVGRMAARNEAQETAAYRKEMVDKYIAIARSKSWLGWGTSGYPRVAGMASIDNYYLLLSLRHGFIAAGLLVGVLLSTLFRLYRNGMRYAPLAPPARSLSFALAGIYAGLTFALATVYMGLNLVPLFFFLTGVTENYLLAGGDKTLRLRAEPAPPEKKTFQFQRVIA